MKINLDLSSGTLIEIELADGKKLTEKDINAIVIDPYFTRRDEVVEFAQLTGVAAGDREVDKCSLTVSGKSGRIGRKEAVTKKKRVSPAVDDKPKKNETSTTPA